MQQHLESLVQDNSSDVFDLQAQMVKLGAVQSTIAQLMERIDEIKHNGWHEDRGMAYLSIIEIERTVRLIDLGFHPLYMTMKENVNSIEESSNKIFEMVVNEGNNQEVRDEPDQVIEKRGNLTKERRKE